MLASLQTVYRSLLDDELVAAITAELAHVLRPQGIALWCDGRYNNPGNRQTRPFGRDALVRAFPGWVITGRSITLLPPLSRRLGRLTPVLYPVLARIPPLRSHYLAILRPPLSRSAAEHPGK